MPDAIAMIDLPEEGLVHGHKLRQTQVGPDISMSWANSALVNTLKRATVTAPARVMSEHEIAVVNPSSVAGLNVNLHNLEADLAGFPRSVLVNSFNVPKATLLLIDSGEAAWTTGQGANVTCTADATAGLFKVGAKAAKMAVGDGATIADGTPAGLLASKDFAALNLTTYRYVRLWIRSSVNTAAGDLALLLDDTAACASPLETLALPALTANTYALVYLQLADPTALGAVISVGVKQTVDLGAFDLYIDDVQALKGGQETRFIHGLFNGGDVRVEIDNDTALGAVDAFSATIRMREVY